MRHVTIFSTKFLSQIRSIFEDSDNFYEEIFEEFLWDKPLKRNNCRLLWEENISSWECGVLKYLRTLANSQYDLFMGIWTKSFVCLLSVKIEHLLKYKTVTFCQISQNNLIMPSNHRFRPTTHIVKTHKSTITILKWFKKSFRSQYKLIRTGTN